MTHVLTLKLNIYASGFKKQAKAKMWRSVPILAGAHASMHSGDQLT